MSSNKRKTLSVSPSVLQKTREKEKVEAKHVEEDPEGDVEMVEEVIYQAILRSFLFLSFRTSSLTFSSFQESRRDSTDLMPPPPLKSDTPPPSTAKSQLPNPTDSSSKSEQQEKPSPAVRRRVSVILTPLSQKKSLVCSPRQLSINVASRVKT